MHLLLQQLKKSSSKLKIQKSVGNKRENQTGNFEQFVTVDRPNLSFIDYVTSTVL